MKSPHYEEPLKDAMNQLKNVDSQLQASPETLHALLKALRSRKNGMPQKNFWMKTAAVFVVSLFCGAFWILKAELRPNPRPETIPGEAQPVDGYFPITYGLTPEESLQTVRVKLPRSALNDFGISVNEIRSDEVTADLLVGESGLPYAIRVVQQN
ncbi:hypothetical protein L0222_06075 [bacterium]|nr:hypothetical protein [bacterium]MCI0602812.1 hypothetical protein [bacterium]